jgi:predicted small lipoprotein YifL
MSAMRAPSHEHGYERAVMNVRPINATAVALALVAGASLVGCGQKGALYLPEATGEVITRPMQTSEANSAPSPDSPSSEQKKPAASPAQPPATP